MQGLFFVLIHNRKKQVEKGLLTTTVLSWICDHWAQSGSNCYRQVRKVLKLFNMIKLFISLHKKWENCTPLCWHCTHFVSLLIWFVWGEKNATQKNLHHLLNLARGLLILLQYKTYKQGKVLETFINSNSEGLLVLVKVQTTFQFSPNCPNNVFRAVKKAVCVRGEGSFRSDGWLFLTLFPSLSALIRASFRCSAYGGTHIWYHWNYS